MGLLRGMKNDCFKTTKKVLLKQLKLRLKGGASVFSRVILKVVRGFKDPPKIDFLS